MYAADLADKEACWLSEARQFPQIPGQKLADDYAAYRNQSAEAAEQISKLITLARNKPVLSKALRAWYDGLQQGQAIGISSLLLFGLGSSHRPGNFLWALRSGLSKSPVRSNLNIQHDNFSFLSATFFPDPSSQTSHVKFNYKDISCIRMLSMAVEVITGKPFPIGPREDKATGDSLVLSKEPLAPAVPLINLTNHNLPLILQAMGSEFYAVQLYGSHPNAMLSPSHSALIYKDRGTKEWMVFEAYWPGLPVRKMPFREWTAWEGHPLAKAKIVALGSIGSTSLPAEKANELKEKYGLKNREPRVAISSR